MRSRHQMEKYLIYALHSSNEELIQILDNPDTDNSDLRILEEVLNDRATYFRKKWPTLVFMNKIFDYESALGWDE